MPATLRKGNKNPDVVRLKRLLNTRVRPSPGLSESDDFGPKTETAVRSFQAQARLPITGAADPATWAALEAKSAPPQNRAQPAVPAVVGKSSGQKPPPATVASRTLLKSQKSAQVEIEVYVEVRADARSTDPNVVGLTKVEPHGTLAAKDTSGKPAFFSVPGYAFKPQNGRNVITQLDGPARIRGTYAIQTFYGPGASATMRSGYGRGTTPTDEAAGTTSLGFHESCHRADYQQYLTSTPFPQFTGRVGMTVEQYKQAAAAFAQAFAAHNQEMGRRSHANTDEVGYKKSAYDAQGARPAP